MKNRNIYTYLKAELLPLELLQEKLNKSLYGLNLSGLALRTRSKIIKEKICLALDYDIPRTFSKTKPKFPCQNLDIYTQKSNNLQIWNDEIDKERRYAIIQINEIDIVIKVKLIRGEQLAKLDTTGTFTTKFQARIFIEKNHNTCSLDSPSLSNLTSNQAIISPSDNPNADPSTLKLFNIDDLYEKLLSLVGKELQNKNIVQERSRADEAHKLVCKALGYLGFDDDGQFPDIKQQLLEVKLQMSPTIDLGLHLPNSETSINLKIDNYLVRCRDIRYLILIADRKNDNSFVIKNVNLISGYYFFDHFALFGGKVKNSKIQIPLPNDFFT
jgi:hypothetical protein